MPGSLKVRGASDATQQARTLSSREWDINTTHQRPHMSNGVDAGGMPIPNADDIINAEYLAETSGGTDTITLTLNRAPSAYATHQRFHFKAANTNTGSATLNVNGLGAKTIKKKNVEGGTLVVLAAGDIIQDGVYTVTYNGTDFILEAIDGGGLQNVSQGDLNTSTGSVSSTSSTGANLTLPGGDYGFYPTTSSGGDAGNANETSARIFYNADQGAVSTATYIHLVGNTQKAMTAYQRYITSSPPFDMGDGEAGGFIFLQLDKNKNVISYYCADVPPWGYNGPTDIRACYQCPLSGKKYRKTHKKRTLEQVLDGVPSEEVLEEITQEIKNADMGLLPTPFAAVPKDHTVVMLDPMDGKIRDLIEYQNQGGGEDITGALKRGLITADGRDLKRAGPKGVKIKKLKFKNSRVGS